MDRRLADAYRYLRCESARRNDPWGWYRDALDVIHDELTANAWALAVGDGALMLIRAMQRVEALRDALK